jgi:ketosteroid isomerase-like protein
MCAGFHLGPAGEPAATGNNAAAPAADAATAAAEVKAAEAELLAAMKAKDAKRVTAAYASDAEIMNPGMAPGTGADMAKSFDDPAFTLDFTNTRTDVAASGDMAYTRGTFDVTFTNPETRKVEAMSGNYVTVYKKQADGSWKAVQDIATPGPAKS